MARSWQRDRMTAMLDCGAQTVGDLIEGLIIIFRSHIEYKQSDGGLNILKSSVRNLSELIFFMPRHSKNGGGALDVTPVCVCVCADVRPSVIKIWCPLNNF